MPRDLRFLLKTHYSDSRALVIGINEYAHASPLSDAVNDANGVRSALISNLAFQEDRVTLLTDGEATKDNILRAFLDFAKDDVELDDRILFFFAGHGLTKRGIRGEVGYLVPSDGDPARLSTLLRWDDLTRNAELVRAKHMLFIMDACYGGLALTRVLAPGSTRFLKDMLLRYSRQVLTAGKADEVVADSGGPLAGHSVFTGHLLEGLRGNAWSDGDVLTANGLMSYVYGKVARDKNSFQTPHYGYFDGDGDFILRAPSLHALEEARDKDLDTLVVVPLTDEEPNEEGTAAKVKRTKSLLASESSAIELHDFLVEEVRRFLAATNEDHFRTAGSYSREELLSRIERYEEVVGDLSRVTACVAYWARPSHKTILQKVFSRSTDHLDDTSGVSTWIYLRWYPIVLDLYCCGVAAVAGERVDSLANIFYSSVGAKTYDEHERFLVDRVANAMLKLNQQEIFKLLPGHDRHYTPLSEHLFKIVQPLLDDLLFIGKGYESAFDTFEMLFALAVADLQKQQDRSIWGPIGRFGWKHRHHSPLVRLFKEAASEGSNWAPLKAGLFGGSAARFSDLANAFNEQVSRLQWM